MEINMIKSNENYLLAKGNRRNKMKNSESFPFLGILTLIFITLKLTGYITWSWWWVLSPVWISFGIAFGIVVIAFICAFIVTFFSNNRGK
jgi:ABC-type phosphate/phosphonate transport system permease subunit